MPTGQQYTARDTQTGKVVTFRWNSSTPPSDADVADVFAEARGGAKPAAASGLDRLIDLLPAAGGTVGGIVGGIGGTVAGMGVGGVPGAIGGATLGGGAGEAVKQLINRGRGKVSPADSMQALKEIGTQGAINGAAEATGQLAIGPAMSFMGKRLMQSAVKPGLKVLLKGAKAGEATPQVVKTLLDEGVNVTPGGLAKLQDLIGSTNTEINAAVQGAPGSISNVKVASRLTPTAREFATQVNPQPDLEAISQVGQNFLDSRPTATMTPAEAQRLKVGTYRRIGDKYGSASPASIEAEKALARGLKEEIATAAPQVSALNAREGKLLEAQDVVSKRVAVSGNKDPIGFAWVAHNPTTFLAALIDRNPAIKSMLARGLYSSAGAAAKTSPALIRTAIWALVSEDPSGAVASATTTGPAGR